MIQTFHRKTGLGPCFNDHTFHHLGILYLSTESSIDNFRHSLGWNHGEKNYFDHSSFQKSMQKSFPKLTTSLASPTLKATWATQGLVLVYILKPDVKRASSITVTTTHMA
jgi:hypothetical protein